MADSKSRRFSGRGGGVTARRIAVALMTVLALSSAVALTFLATFELDRIRPWIVEQTHAATGRNLSLDGRLHLGFFPPRVIVHDARFGNATWGSRPDMATVESLELGLALAPLLLERRVVIDRLRLRNVDVLLERDEHGQGNWQWGAREHDSLRPEAVPPGEPAASNLEASTPSEETPFAIPELRDVRLDHVRVTLRGARDTETRRIDVESLRLRPDGDRLALALRARWNDSAISGDGSVGSFAGLDGSQGAWPIALALDVAGVKAFLDGTLARPLEGKGAALALSASGADLAPISAIIGADLPAGRAWSVALRIDETEPRHISLRDVALVLGTSSVAGEAQLVLGPRPKLDATLHAASLDLADFTRRSTLRASPGPGGTRAASGSGGGGGGGSARHRGVFSDVPIDLELLDRLDGTVALAADRVLWNQLVVSEVDARGTLAAGRFDAALQRALIGSGHATASLEVSARERVFASQLRIDGVALGRVLADLGVTNVLRDAPTSARIELRGAGTSWHEIAGSLDGLVSVDVMEGSVSRRVFDLVRGDLLSMLRPLLVADADTPLRCAVVRFDVVDGLARSRVIAVDGTRAVTSGGGTIDLGRERIAIRLRSHLNDTVLGNAVVPIEIAGALGAPRVDVSTAAAVGSIASSGLGATLREATGIDLEILGGGADGSSSAAPPSCSEARAIAAGEAAAMPAPTRPTAPGSDAVRSLREGLKGLFGR